jgi:hypothetical protein
LIELKNTVLHIAPKKRGALPDAALNCCLRKKQFLPISRVYGQPSFKDFDTLAPSL